VLGTLSGVGDLIRCWGPHQVLGFSYQVLGTSSGVGVFMQIYHGNGARFNDWGLVGI